MKSGSLKVLICDDVAEIQGILKRFAESVEGFEVCSMASDGKEAMELFEAHRPDVVLLDVDMPVKTGIEVAEFIHDIDPHVFLIFATAHTGYMDRAFDVYAFDYWVKPFRKERVVSTLGRIKELRERLDGDFSPAPVPPPSPKTDISRLMIKKKDAVAFLDTSEIILIQREDRATAIYTAAEVHRTGDSLGALEQRLPQGRFFRSHKSYIINLTYIDSITPYGRWTHAIKFKGIREDALITSDKLEELKGYFN